MTDKHAAADHVNSDAPVPRTEPDMPLTGRLLIVAFAITVYGVIFGSHFYTADYVLR